MSKILGIDFGEKRTGLAITDDLHMIAAPLETVATTGLMDRLAILIAKEKCEIVVVGEAKYLNGMDSAITAVQADFVAKFQKRFPEVRVERVNEMFTSKMASQAMVASGMRKSERQKKENIDMISAAILLQTYLDYGRTKR
jgi:putative Holliday junction resolvase